MSDHMDDPVEARLRDYFAGELRQAELDYPRLLRRGHASRLPTVGLLAAGIVLVLAIVLLRPLLSGTVPATGGTGGPGGVAQSSPAAPSATSAAQATPIPRLTPLPAPTSGCGPIPSKGLAGFQPDDATVAASVVNAYEQYLAAGRWADAWSCVSAYSRKATTLAAWSQSMAARNRQGAKAYTIDAPSRDWTILHYGYAGAIETDVRTAADVSHAYAVWVHHPDMAMVSAGDEGFLVAPLRDDTGWRIWWVH